MNGFDKWTSGITPEKIADVISHLQCFTVADFCPLYHECTVDADRIKSSFDSVCKCREKICEYFDKEVEE